VPKFVSNCALTPVDLVTNIPRLMSVRIPFLRHDARRVCIAFTGVARPAWCGRVCWCSARGGERIETD
jgi:hypothetical protein